MANMWEKAISILAGNLNSGLLQLMLKSTFILICQECSLVLVPNLAKYSHRFVGVPNALTKVVSIVELKCETY